MQMWRWLTSEITIASLQLCSPFPGPSTFTCLFTFTNNEKERRTIMHARRMMQKRNCFAKSTIRFHRQHCHIDEMKTTQLCTQQNGDRCVYKEYQRLLTTPHKNFHIANCKSAKMLRSADNKTQVGRPISRYHRFSRWPELYLRTL